MSDNDFNNDLRNNTDSSAHVSERAEKILAFKKAMRQQQADLQEESPSGSDDDGGIQVSNEQEAAEESNWETDLSLRIAERVQRLKNKKEDTADIAKDDSVKNDGGINSKRKKKRYKSVKETLLGMLPGKNDSIGERIRKIVFLGSLITMVVCGSIILNYYIDVNGSKKYYLELDSIYDNSNKIPQPTDTLQVDDDADLWTYPLLGGAARLLELNSETVGYLRIPGTGIEYPVVQAEDNEKYLYKGFDLKEARAGAIFLDYRNHFDHVADNRLVAPNSENLVVYGHNMENGDMFGKLKNYRNNKNYYGNHPIIELNSNYKHYSYKIFAFFIADTDDKTDFNYWSSLNFNGEEDFYNFVNEAKRRSIRLNNVDVRYGDQILTLSTCSSIFGQGKGGKMVVMARLLREGEDPLEGTQDSVANTNIKWPPSYYKYNKKESYDPDAEFIPYPFEEVETNNGQEKEN